MFTAINGNKSPQVEMAEATRLNSIEQNKTKNNGGQTNKISGSWTLHWIVFTTESVIFWPALAHYLASLHPSLFISSLVILH